MRVLMVQTPSVEGITQERVYPIGIVSLASCLNKSGHEVDLFDMNLEVDPYGSLKEKLLCFRPEVVGLSLRNIDPLANKTSSLIPPFVVTVRLISLILPQSWLIAGGTGFSLFPERLMLELPELHYGIVGEAETSYPALLSSLENPPALKGLCRRENGGIRVLPPSREFDMAAYTVPDVISVYHFMVNVPGETEETMQKGLDFLERIYELHARQRNLGAVVLNNIRILPGTPIEAAARENGVIRPDTDLLYPTYYNPPPFDKFRFYFTDPNFFDPGRMGQERAKHLSALLKTRNIRFGIEGRVNDIHDETIGALADAGLRHILIGLESGKDSSLERMNKMTTVAQNEQAIRALRKHGIEPNIGFIMFEPDATLEDIRVNFEFLKRNDLLKNLPITANVLYHHQIILKGTPAYQKMRQEGRLIIENDTAYEGAAKFTDEQVAVLGSN